MLVQNKALIRAFRKNARSKNSIESFTLELDMKMAFELTWPKLKYVLTREVWQWLTAPTQLKYDSKNRSRSAQG